MGTDARIDNLREELGGEATEEEVVETTETEKTDEEEATEEEESTESTEKSEEEETTEEETTDENAFKMPEKFEGKTVEEIAKSYQELETLIGQRALGKDERKDLSKAGLNRKDLGSMEEMKKMIDGVDFTKMNPGEFAQWLIEATDKRATAQAEQIYRTASTVQQAVRTESTEAIKEFPLLKSNPEFRNLVLSVIEADAGRGDITPLKEACKKVQAMVMVSKKADAKVVTEKTRKRTAIETTQGGQGDKKNTEEEDVIAGILGGKKSPSMGGLGI